jgi:hypothetical protein
VARFVRIARTQRLDYDGFIYEIYLSEGLGKNSRLGPTQGGAVFMWGYRPHGVPAHERGAAGAGQPLGSDSAPAGRTTARRWPSANKAKANRISVTGRKGAPPAAKTTGPRGHFTKDGQEPDSTANDKGGWYLAWSPCYPRKITHAPKEGHFSFRFAPDPPRHETL